MKKMLYLDKIRKCYAAKSLLLNGMNSNFPSENCRSREKYKGTYNQTMLNLGLSVPNTTLIFAPYLWNYIT